MDAGAKKLHDILGTGNQFLIPFFQRSYSWTRTHWLRLRDDIWTLAEQQEPGLHFLGPLVCTSVPRLPGEVPAFQLIDGQQRLTTITVILTALRDACRQRDLEAIGAKIHETYLIHRHEQDLARYKVIPRLGDREVLMSLIEKGYRSQHATTGIARAYRFFRSCIDRWIEPAPAAKGNKLLAVISHQLPLVVITIDSENPYEIFESLNSTGLPLEQSDLIRNYLFMQIRLEDQEQFNDAYWREFEARFDQANGHAAIPQTPFYRSYLMREGRYSKRNATFVDFKDQNQRRRLSPSAQIDELQRYAGDELRLRRPATCPEPWLREPLHAVEMLEITTAHPLLMNLLDRWRDSQIDDAMLEGCISDLASFVLRRSICGESTRQYARWFVEAVASIKEDPQEDLRRYYFGRGWPDDAAFIPRLVEFPLYRREPKKGSLILEALERSYGHKERPDLGKCTIEHIMPQTLGSGEAGADWKRMLGGDWKAVHQKWLHTLGNITLTGYNPDLGNRRFSDKRQLLAHSNLSLNHRVAEEATWTEAAIRRRGDLLSAEVAALWPRPVGSPYVPASTSGLTGTDAPRGKEFYRAYWSAFRGVLETRHADLVAQDAGPSSELRFSIANGDAYMWTRFSRRAREISVGITFRRKRGRAIMSRLRTHRDTIDRSCGEPVRWHDGWGGGGIVLSESGHSFRNPEEWLEQHDWLAERLDLLRRVVLPEVQALCAEIPPSGGRASEGKAIRLEFWSTFRERLRATHPHLEPTRPGPQGLGCKLGRRGCRIVARYRARAGELRILAMFRGPAAAIFDALASERQAVEAEIGRPLEWSRPPGRAVAKIALTGPGVDLRRRESWSDHQQWLEERLAVFHKVFRDRIERVQGSPGLDASS